MSKDDYKEKNLNDDSEIMIDDLSEKEKKSKKRGLFFSTFALSAIIHTLLIAILVLLVIPSNEEKKKDIFITTQVIEELPEEEPQQKVERDVVRQKVDIVVDSNTSLQPIVTQEEVSDHMETENDMDTQTAEGVSDAISDLPLVGTGVVGTIGGGGGGGGAFGQRSGGGRRKAVLQGGGSRQTESSVDAALRWLVRHQEKEGFWSSEKYGNDNDRNGFRRNQLEPHLALTGLSMLAFLSAGHTPKVGKYSATLNRATDWLLKQQHPDGSFGTNQESREYSIYDNAVCTLALVELAAMCPDSRYRAAAQKALDYLYTFKRTQGHHRVVNGKPNTTSVVGWVMMAFKGGKIAGLKVPDDVFEKYREILDGMADKDSSGKPTIVHYVTKGDRNHNSTTMTCAGMLIYEYLGAKRVELNAMADIVVKELPVWGAYSMNNDIHRWYYATLALFQHGGDHWKTWNKVMSKVLVDNQRKGGPLDGSLQDVDGSWDSEGDFWGRNLGRTYMTVMGAFCLEVYYRYEAVLR